MKRLWKTIPPCYSDVHGFMAVINETDGMGDFGVGKGTAMMDQKRRAWAEDVLALANVPGDILPELVSGRTPWDWLPEPG